MCGDYLLRESCVLSKQRKRRTAEVAQLCVMLKLVQFGNGIRNTWKFGKCGVGEGWRRSVGPIA